jgi:trafficking protein particle complex subunit 2
MSATQVLLFVIVGQNEPLYEAEIHKRGAAGNSDAVARQNYFVVHSALDLVEKASWTSQNVRVVKRWDAWELLSTHKIQ